MLLKEKGTTSLISYLKIKNGGNFWIENFSKAMYIEAYGLEYSLYKMMAGSSGSFKHSIWLFIWKKREYLNFLIKNVLDFNFETQVYIELLNN